MKLEIIHSTHYQYTEPIAESVMEVRLQPMDGVGQRCLAFKLDISSGIKPRSYMDGYGNVVHYFNLVRPRAGRLWRPASRPTQTQAKSLSTTS